MQNAQTTHVEPSAEELKQFQQDLAQRCQDFQALKGEEVVEELNSPRKPKFMKMISSVLNRLNLTDLSRPTNLEVEDDYNPDAYAEKEVADYRAIEISASQLHLTQILLNAKKVGINSRGWHINKNAVSGDGQAISIANNKTVINFTPNDGALKVQSLTKQGVPTEHLMFEKDAQPQGPCGSLHLDLGSCDEIIDTDLLRSIIDLSTKSPALS